MKLIIDIPEEYKDLFDTERCKSKFDSLCTNEFGYVLRKAVENGTPLDDIKAEITEHHDIHLGKLNSRSNVGILMFGSDAYDRGIKHAIEILDNIGKAESEDKE